MDRLAEIRARWAIPLRTLDQTLNAAEDIAYLLARVEEAEGRRCDKCQWWGEPEQAGGKTYAECAGFPPHKTACDHYCGMWKGKEVTP